MNFVSLYGDDVCLFIHNPTSSNPCCGDDVCIVTVDQNTYKFSLKHYMYHFEGMLMTDNYHQFQGGCVFGFTWLCWIFTVMDLSLILLMVNYIVLVLLGFRYTVFVSFLVFPGLSVAFSGSSSSLSSSSPTGSGGSAQNFRSSA